MNSLEIYKLSNLFKLIMINNENPYLFKNHKIVFNKFVTNEDLINLIGGKDPYFNINEYDGYYSSIEVDNNIFILFNNECHTDEIAFGVFFYLRPMCINNIYIPYSSFMSIYNNTCNISNKYVYDNCIKNILLDLISQMDDMGLDYILTDSKTILHEYKLEYVLKSIIKSTKKCKSELLN